MSTCWYVLRSKPNKENALWNQVVSSGFEIFYPRVHVHPVNPRSQKVKPYFPGYMFVHVDLDSASVSFFQWMPYSQGLVNFDGQPAIVPEGLIQVIRKRIEIRSQENNPINLLRPGDVVSIDHGPFAGYEAIFDTRLKGEERSRVLLKLISKRQMRLELPTSYIKKTSTFQKSTASSGGRGDADLNC